MCFNYDQERVGITLELAVPDGDPDFSNEFDVSFEVTTSATTTIKFSAPQEVDLSANNNLYALKDSTITVSVETNNWHYTCASITETFVTYNLNFQFTLCQRMAF